MKVSEDCRNGLCKCLMGAALVFLLLWNSPVQAAENNNGKITIDVPILAGVVRYADLFSYPTYVAIALENASLVPWHVVVVDAHAFKYKDAMIGFIEKKGTLYSYRLRIMLGFAGVNKNVDIPVEISTSNIGAGHLTVFVHPPLSSLFPQYLLDKLGSKIRAFSAGPFQQNLLTYLDGLSKGLPQNAGDAALRERILFDNYNLPARGMGVAMHEPGDAEPLQDQLMLIATLAIWFVIVPLVLLGTYLWRRRVRRRRRAA